MSREREDKRQGAALGPASRAFMRLSAGEAALEEEGPSRARRLLALALAGLILIAVPLIWASTGPGGDQAQAVTVKKSGPGSDDDDEGGSGDDDKDDDGSAATAGTGSKDSAQTAGTTKGTQSPTDDANSAVTQGTGSKDSGKTAGTTRGTADTDDDKGSAKTGGTGSKDSAKTAGTTKGTREPVPA